MSEENQPRGDETKAPEGGGDNTPPADNTQTPPAPQDNPSSIAFDINAVPEEQRGVIGMFHKDGQLNLAELFKSHHSAQQMIGEQKSLPKTPEGYIEKGMTFNVDGEELPVDTEHPLFKPFLEGAHKAGLSRKKVVEILGEIVPMIVREDKELLANFEKMKAEVPEADKTFVANGVQELVNKGVLTEDDQKNIVDFAITPERVTSLKKLLSHTGTSVASGDNRMTQLTETEVHQQIKDLITKGDNAKAKALAQEHGIGWHEGGGFTGTAGGGTPSDRYIDPDGWRRRQEEAKNKNTS